MKLLLATAFLFTFIECLLAEPPAGYVLKWADEFDGTQLNLAKWKHWNPGKRREAMNIPEAVTVADGKLVITTFTEGGRHSTGMISTEGLFEHAFGYYEARIQWADAPGQWTAFWSQTPTIGKPLGDVAAAGLELDFVEHRQVNETGKSNADKANFTLHWDGYGPAHRGKGHQTPALGLDKGFHLYACEWTDSAYRFFIDGKLQWEVHEPISKRPQFLILSSEVESGAWSHEVPKEGYGDRASSRVKLTVDYVRVYSRP